MSPLNFSASFAAFSRFLVITISTNIDIEHPVEEVDVYGKKINESSDSVIDLDIYPNYLKMQNLECVYFYSERGVTMRMAAPCKEEQRRYG